MNELVAGIGSAFLMGIVTSISPCPLATNIAAISYIGRKVGKPRYLFISGILYAAGRTAAYVAVAAVLVASLFSVPQLALFLQRYMHLALGPILIVAGMFLMGLIEFESSGSGVSGGLQQRVDRLGIWGALLLGMVFALSFCPTSAALYFGALIPVSLELESPVLIPAAYGIGTAVPVVLFAILLATSVELMGRAYKALAKFERIARSATGAIFIVVGIYFALKYVYRVF